MLSKLVTWFVIILVVIYVAKNPGQVGGWIHTAFSSGSKLISSVGGK